MLWDVEVLINVGDDNFAGFQYEHPLATAPDLRLRVRAEDAREAAERAFFVGNRMGPDEDGHNWPSDVRSVSVGDVAIVKGEYHKYPQALICDSVGWTVKDPADLPNPRVPLEGTAHTSREAS